MVLKFLIDAFKTSTEKPREESEERCCDNPSPAYIYTIITRWSHEDVYVCNNCGKARFEEHAFSF